MTTLTYDILEVGEDFVYGRLSIPSTFDLYEEITEEVDEYELEEGELGHEDGPDARNAEIRSSTIHWLTDECEITKAATTALVDQINEDYFDIHAPEAPDWQWTTYSDPDDHYDWHQDHYADEELDEDNFVRTLSISICMSPSEVYKGAEFFIKDGSETNVRVFKMGFGDFIVFPSDVEHRVNALREGERESLVVWYGYTQN